MSREWSVYGVRGASYMQKNSTTLNLDKSITDLSLAELREEWAKYWGMPAHERIGRVTLEKSLQFKLREARGEWLNAEQKERLDNLIASYKRNPKFFDDGLSELKPGLRLVKNYNGQHHSVEVLAKGFQYRDRTYGSLSEIATVIAGTRWNGWIFFGLKKREKKQ